MLLVNSLSFNGTAFTLLLLMAIFGRIVKPTPALTSDKIGSFCPTSTIFSKIIPC